MDKSQPKKQKIIPAGGKPLKAPVPRPIPQKPPKQNPPGTPGK